MKKITFKGFIVNLSVTVASLFLFLVVLEFIAWIGNVTPLQLRDTHFQFDSQNNHYLTSKGQPFRKEKEDNTFRIFIFGGSSIYRQDFSPLRELLIKEFPAMQFEIINVGNNAYGTNRLVPIVKEASQFNPDLFILYSGHNEFLELFIQENIYFNTAQFFRRKLLSLRGYALMVKMVNGAMSMWGEKILLPLKDHVHINWAHPLDKNQRTLIYKRYESNINHMVNFALKRDIPTIISTVAYNYIDDRYISPRFFSRKHKNTRFSKNQIAIDKVDETQVFQFAKRPIKDPYIENRLGKYYFERQDYKKAAEYFISAAEVDFQPFRANRITNGIISKIAANLVLPVADVKQAVVQHSHLMIPDFKLFDDWCHLNREGNLVMQKTFFNTIKESNVVINQ